MEWRGDGIMAVSTSTPLSPNEKRRGQRLAANRCLDCLAGGGSGFRQHINAPAVLVESDFAVRQGE